MGKWWAFAAAIVLAFWLDLAHGSVAIPWAEIGKILLGQPSAQPGWATVVWEFRLPKALTAALVGIGLAVSGLQMQALFRNPLAGPYLLGTTAGASLGVALLIVLGGGWGLAMLAGPWAGWLLIGAAGAGAVLAMLLVLAVAGRLRDPLALLVVGLMLSSSVSALVALLQYVSSQDELQRYVIWSFGSLGGLGWPQLRVLGLVVGLGTLASWRFARALNVWALGNEHAHSLGLHLARTRWGVVVLASLLAGAVTAFCGPVGFVGLAVPHLARAWFRTADHRVLLPGSVAWGCLVMLLCDWLCQPPGTDQMLPINVVTSLLGAPVVVWVMLAQR
jgi:iron complex transport system permease protein